MSYQDTTTKERREEAVSAKTLCEELIERFDLKPDPQAQWDDCLLVSAEAVVSVLSCLKKEKGFQILLDITAIDYLAFPGHRDARFAVVYIVKSLKNSQRISLKVMLEEDDLRIATVSHLWKIADWLERETFDQYGIQFQGHPNLKRLLNHHQFIGHPLRKDYPVQKRQKLSVNDPMLDQLHDRLERNGYAVLEEATAEESVSMGERR